MKPSCYLRTMTPVRRIGPIPAFRGTRVPGSIGSAPTAQAGFALRRRAP